MISYEPGDIRASEEFERVLLRVDLLEDLAYLCRELGEHAVALVALRALGFSEKEIQKIFGCSMGAIRDLDAEISLAICLRQHPDLRAELEGDMGGPC